jgi:hypothetical protein
MVCVWNLFGNLQMTKVITSAAGLVLLDKDEQIANQDAVRTHLLSADTMVHSAGVQALFHASIHGNTGLMRRLLIDVISDTMGYRRQGLISWMRKHSPMELVGKEIKLTGMIESEAQRKLMLEMFPNEDPALFVVGERRPFLVDAANAQFFGKDKANAEQVKPVFQATLLSPVFAVQKKFNSAIENTVNGKPVDTSKPYYAGKYGDQVAKAMEDIKAILDTLPADVTKDVIEAQARIKTDTEFLAAAAAAQEPANKEDDGEPKERLVG